MKYLFFLLVLLPACCKETTTVTPQPVSKRIIEGKWEPLIKGTPQWQYEFYYGIMKQTAFVGDTPVVSKEFSYGVRNDTIFIGGDNGTLPRQWIYRFELDSLMNVREVGVQISQLSWLVKR